MKTKTKIRTLGLALAWPLISMLPATSVQAQVSVGIQFGLPGMNIGVNMPYYPTMVQVPGYPVYYNPQADANYFFYDGLYWVYSRDNWYSSSWYNGPWQMTGRDFVPFYILRVPVRYYRQPPGYFRGWSVDAPPRWAEHWGRDWEQRRPGWDRWDRRNTPTAAPLPRYQQKYPSDRYPAVEQQRSIRSDNYRYQSREAVTRQQLGMTPPVVQRPAEPRKPDKAAQRSNAVQAQQRMPAQTRSRDNCQPGTPGCREGQGPKVKPGQQSGDDDRGRGRP